MKMWMKSPSLKTDRSHLGEVSEGETNGFREKDMAS